jgi:nitrogen regulatory protein PII-like uncharacterized protein
MPAQDQEEENAKLINLGFLNQVDKVHLNVGQNLIVITEDKLRLCLSESLKKIERKYSWVAPTGVFLTILLSLITADFKNLGLSADTWKAVFIIAAILSLAWLVYSIIQSTKAETIDNVVEKIKKEPREKTLN